MAYPLLTAEGKRFFSDEAPLITESYLNCKVLEHEETEKNQ